MKIAWCLFFVFVLFVCLFVCLFGGVGVRRGFCDDGSGGRWFGQCDIKPANVDLIKGRFGVCFCLFFKYENMQDKLSVT